MYITINFLNYYFSGLWHEQSRPDSVNFIEVRKDLILTSYLCDFQRRGIFIHR